MTNSNIQLSRSLFWDVNYDKIDMKKNAPTNFLNRTHNL